MQNTYTKLRQGSKKADVVVRNNTVADPPEENPGGQGGSCIACAQTSRGRVIAGGADESHNSHTSRLTVRQRHGILFDELDLSGLDSLAHKLVDTAHQLLAKYHDVFSLDPAEFGCTHSIEHMIKITDDTPFKD